MKKKRVSPVSPGSWVDPPARPGFARFLHWPIFCLTRTSPATGSRVDQPGQSGFNNYGYNDIYPKTNCSEFVFFFPSSVWLIMHRMGENHNQSESLNCSIHNLFRFVFYGVITISNKHPDIWLIINFASSIFFYHIIK